MQDESIQLESVTMMLKGLESDDSIAQQQIWQRYANQLLELARKQLRSMPGAAIDEEDILVSVFDRLFSSTQRKQFKRLENRNDLWIVLLTLVKQRVASRYRSELAAKRGAGKIVDANRKSASDDEDSVGHELGRSLEPGPQTIAAFREQLSEIINQLPDEPSREILLLRMENHNNREIAEKLGLALRSVERKISLIKRICEAQLTESS